MDWKANLLWDDYRAWQAELQRAERPNVRRERKGREEGGRKDFLELSFHVWKLHKSSTQTEESHKYQMKAFKAAPWQPAWQLDAQMVEHQPQL